MLGALCLLYSWLHATVAVTSVLSVVVTNPCLGSCKCEMNVVAAVCITVVMMNINIATADAYAVGEVNAIFGLACHVIPAEPQLG